MIKKVTNIIVQEQNKFISYLQLFFSYSDLTSI